MTDTLDMLYAKLTKGFSDNPSRRIYVLVDPFVLDPFDYDNGLSEDVERIDIRIDFANMDADQHPYLLVCSEHTVQTLRESLRLAVNEQASSLMESTQGFAIGGWLLSDASPDVLARYLAMAMQQSPHRRSIRKYCRWADRRVFEWLWPQLDAEQRSALLGPVTQWTILNRRGQFTRHAVQPPETAGKQFHPQLILTQAQKKRLPDCALTQQVLRGWRSFTDELPEDYLARAHAAIASGRTLGLVSDSDVVLFAAYVLQVHAQLAEHPQIIQRVNDAQAQQAPLGVALEAIDDPDGWDRIRHELNGSDATYSH